ncbi:hypothetical protein [Pseudomonas juntendi]
MGIELDVLVGHPEHELLFVATQVARAAGLKNPSTAVGNFHSQTIGYKVQVGNLPSLPNIVRDGHKIKSNHKAGRDLAGLIRQERISLPKDGLTRQE